MSDQAIYRRQRNHVRRLERQLATTDFTTRMRNQMALDLNPDEQIVDDDFVGIGWGSELGRKAAGKSLPNVGIIIATTQRIRFATVDQKQPTELSVRAIRLVHDEDAALTMTWRAGGSNQAVTLYFGKRRAPVAEYLRQATLEGGRAPSTGAATPKLSIFDKLRGRL